MKKLIKLSFIALMGIQVHAQPKVYVTRNISPEGLMAVYKALGVKAKGKVAVKVSTGEAGNPNYLQPSLIGPLVKKVKGTIVECNTAYGGKRSTTEEHLKVAEEHGFTKIAKVDIMDSEGEMKIPVKDTKYIKYDIVGSHLKNYNFMINLAHFKAAKKNKNMTSVVIGKNVTSIGANSFANSKKLANVTFKGTKAVKVGSKAFKGTSAKMKVVIPKKMSKKTRNTLKRNLKKAGISKKTVYKKK